MNCNIQSKLLDFISINQDQLKYWLEGEDGSNSKTLTTAFHNQSSNEIHLDKDRLTIAQIDSTTTSIYVVRILLIPVNKYCNE